MPKTYSAENHDWDLTLHAAGELLAAGIHLDQQPTTGSLTRGFSFLTGSMVLSFAALESYAASCAFTLDNNPSFPGFDFQAYRSERAFWRKLEMLAAALGFATDKSKGLFREISDMQRWRNLVVHASPYGIEAAETPDTKARTRQHAKRRHLQYARMVDVKNARRFYAATVAFTRLIEDRTGEKSVTEATCQGLE